MKFGFFNRHKTAYIGKICRKSLVMKKFATISSILCEDKLTWENKLFLTFDMDWAHDVVLSDTINLIEDSGVAATWFVTHQTPMLAKLRANPNFELGIHPNFNYLLDGDPRNGANSKDVISRMKSLVPEAVSVRSHSMTQSSYLLDYFKNAEITHDVNHFIPSHINLRLKPWLLWNGMIRVPYFWEDDIACLYGSGCNITSLAKRVGLKVFDFHPIHIFLNTEHFDRYEKTRHLHYNPKELIKYRYAGVGTRTRLLEFLNLTNFLP